MYDLKKNVLLRRNPFILEKKNFDNLQEFKDDVHDSMAAVLGKRDQLAQSIIEDCFNQTNFRQTSVDGSADQ